MSEEAATVKMHMSPAKRDTRATARQRQRAKNVATLTDTEFRLLVFAYVDFHWGIAPPQLRPANVELHVFALSWVAEVIGVHRTVLGRAFQSLWRRGYLVNRPNRRGVVALQVAVHAFDDVRALFETPEGRAAFCALRLRGATLVR